MTGKTSTWIWCKKKLEFLLKTLSRVTISEMLKAETQQGMLKRPRIIEVSKSYQKEAYLYNFFFRVKIRYQGIFAIWYSGEWNAQSARGQLVCVFWKISHQPISYDLYHIEGRMKRTEISLSGFFGQRQNICTSLSWKQNTLHLTAETQLTFGLKKHIYSSSFSLLLLEWKCKSFLTD